MKQKDGTTTANVGNYLAQSAFVLAIASEHLSSKAKEELGVEAIQALELAIEKGYNDILYLQSDPDVAALRSISGFDSLIERIKSRTFIARNSFRFGISGIQNELCESCIALGSFRICSLVAIGIGSGYRGPMLFDELYQ